MPESTPGRSLPRRHGFLAVGTASFLLTASSSAPSPLYPLYQQQWGFSPGMLTAVFAVYALALLATLLTIGSISDHVGRRPVLIGALLLLVVSMGVFVLADDVGWLVLARVLQGLAVGAATGAVSAAVIDLQPSPPARILRQQCRAVARARPRCGRGGAARAVRALSHRAGLRPRRRDRAVAGRRARLRPRPGARAGLRVPRGRAAQPAAERVRAGRGCGARTW